MKTARSAGLKFLVFSPAEPGAAYGKAGLRAASGGSNWVWATSPTSAQNGPDGAFAPCLPEPVWGQQAQLAKLIHARELITVIYKNSFILLDSV